MIAAGSAYLRIVGPFYGFFGLGMALYFASQGAGALKWPLLAGLSRMVIAVGGGYLLLRATARPHAGVCGARAWARSPRPDDRRSRSGRGAWFRDRDDSARKAR